jgi:hypothetical protein
VRQKHHEPETDHRFRARSASVPTVGWVARTIRESARERTRRCRALASCGLRVDSKST